MCRSRPFLRVAALGVASGAVLSFAPRSHAQSPVTFAAPVNANFSAVITGRTADYLLLPCSITAEIAAPPSPGAGTVVLRALHIAAPNFSCFVPLFGTPTQVFVTGLVIDGAPGAGASMAAQPGAPGESLFAGANIFESAIGTINYTAQGIACQLVQNGGGQCSGPFDLSVPGTNSGGIIANGVIGASTGGPTRTVSFQFRGSFPFVMSATWGRIDVLANLTGTIPDGAPACPADFNGVDGLTVQDIFAFLAAWFAGNPAADFNHTSGIGVQDIFDFLGAWFAGC